MSFLYRIRGANFISDERGQVLPLAVFLMIGMLGMCAVVIDFGRALYTYRELQATTDAAALAGARALTYASSIVAVTGSGGVVQQYSAATGGLNARPGLPGVSVTSTPKCLTTLEAQGEACLGNLPYNALEVRQTSVIPLYFARLFGHPTMPLSTVATASSRGGSPRPSNVALIVDSTLSMNAFDLDCGATQMQCALNGVQILLENLSPCPASQGACATNGVITNSFDRASLFTFPNVSSATASIDSNCTSPIPAPSQQNGYWTDPTIGNYVVFWNPPNTQTPVPWSGVPTALPYSFPLAGAGSYIPSGTGTPTYQITPFLADYKVSQNASTLNRNSALVKAAGGANGCRSMLPTNEDGVYGTYYAGVLYAAQSALMAEQAQFPGSENVLILLSDGDATAPKSNGSYPVMPPPANASGNYPSYVGECGQAILAAQAATNAGTLVFSVAYGSPPTGCASDAAGGPYPHIAPCQTMRNMASATQYFYSDYKQSGSNSTCTTGQPVTSLNAIFTAIANQLTEARLIPNNTT